MKGRTSFSILYTAFLVLNGPTLPLISLFHLASAAHSIFEP